MAELHGLLVVDKPGGITSRTAVDRAQFWFPRKTRVGHAGTLDPLATGVLVLCIGAATRLTEYVQAMPKVYRAGIRLGAVSDTDDADGVVTPVAAAAVPSRGDIERELAAFVGTIEQTPPAFSAAKVTGRRAYELARKGKTVELSPRPVTIHAIDVIRYEYPDLEIVVRCGKGTYIRSIARDLGQRLGCGGYIASLRRTDIGGFSERDAVALDADVATARERLLPAWRAVQTAPPLTLPHEQIVRLTQGQTIAAPPGASGESAALAVADDAGETLAIVELKAGALRPIKVLLNVRSE